jgi:hypothetical protein
MSLNKAIYEVLTESVKLTKLDFAEEALKICKIDLEADNITSSSLGIYKPNELILYPYAIHNYAEYMGVEFSAALVKVFFFIAYQYYCDINRRKLNLLKAEKFADKLVKSIGWRPPTVYTEFDFVVRSQHNWAMQWSGLTYEEYKEKFNLKEE